MRDEPLPPLTPRDWLLAATDAFLLVWPLAMMFVLALVVTP